MESEYESGDAPCFGPLLVDGHPVDPDTARDVARFRRAERARLVTARALPSEEREEAIAAGKVFSLEELEAITPRFGS